MELNLSTKFQNAVSIATANKLLDRGIRRLLFRLEVTELHRFGDQLVV